MRILLIGRFYEEGFASHIAAELGALGHTVVHFDPGPKLMAFGSRARFYANRLIGVGHQAVQNLSRALGRSDLGERLDKAVAAHGPIDLTLSIHDYLTAEDAARVKRATRAPLALWFPDPVWTFGRHMFLNAPYDALLFKDPYIVDLLRRKLGKPVYYMPECYSPLSLDPSRVGTVGDSRYACDVTTAGNLYAYRVAILEQVAAHHDLKVWGLPAPRWMAIGDLKPCLQNRFVAHDEKVRAFRGAKIVLNTHNPAEISGTNVRTFEACGAGAFQITDAKAGLADLFAIGKELVTFDRLDDLMDKLTYYLEHPELRQTIAEAGYARARRDHTYAVRLGQLLDTVDGRSSGYPLPALDGESPRAVV